MFIIYVKIILELCNIFLSANASFKKEEEKE